MGANLALNIAEKGFPIAVYNRTWATTEKFVSDAGPLAKCIIACRTLAELASAIRPPRPVIIMVKAGSAVDEQIANLREVLEHDDIIIDAGNANYHDTVRRDSELSKSGLAFIGMGVSGGEEGARHGPSIMAGGLPQSFGRVQKVLTTIAARYKRHPCCAWVGPDGAGHFVKTVHNGIEYADMQMIAEIYGLMRDGLGMSPADMAKVFAKWNIGKLNSYLIEITAKVLATIDPKTGKPLVNVIVDRAGQKGTGKWSVIEAQHLGVAATTLEAAVAARILSSMKDERTRAEGIYGRARARIAVKSTASFVRQLEGALYAGKIAAYAQGFAVMEQASVEKGWDLPLGTIASIWREGCIIRSQFLDLITETFRKRGGKGNLLMSPDFAAMMKANHGALRRTVAAAALSNQPVPALSAALGYFDGYRQSRGTANLIQAQRDFFGAHTFERIGEEGMHRGAWATA
ncbi:MAG: NADP-dependent phosphogluconate dehydrogenase [Alphaproteobacteria bacterium]|nr:NADP-dependent phosphogluconate dehydrogenase [Alphaproteobacteria bacterium]